MPLNLSSLLYEEKGKNASTQNSWEERVRPKFLVFLLGPDRHQSVTLSPRYIPSGTSICGLSTRGTHPFWSGESLGRSCYWHKIISWTLLFFIVLHIKWTPNIWSLWGFLLKEGQNTSLLLKKSSSNSRQVKPWKATKCHGNQLATPTVKPWKLG